MTQVVTMSAVTAAYAAEAVKPSARVRADGAAEQAMDILATEHRQELETVHTALAALRSPTSASLMLLSGRERLPQRNYNDAVRSYREFLEDDPSVDPEEQRDD
ncbi:hypothetical protein [Pararhizobium arenae]|uniref:hypothetical protein n=1 Tax=Pararhizobium arenae TaxID=1856850 RepID=UPI00094AEAEC|nr:hypothetical protein [Pararhizobium arenae]